MASHSVPPQPKVRPLRDDTRLQAAAGDLLYEAKRLFSAGKLYPDIAAAGVGVEDLRLLVLEALLLHLRVLLDFFFPRRSVRNDDVTIADFVPSLPPRFQVDPTWLSDYRSRLDQLLSHLTYDRLKYKQANQMDWPDLPHRLNDMVAFWRIFPLCAGAISAATT